MIAQPFRIQAETKTPDGIGGFTTDWSDVFNVRGYIDLLTGTDQNTQQNAFIELSTHILVIPTYVDGITDAMRVIDGANRSYQITYVDDPVGQHHHLEIYLKFGGITSG